jgi:hypothetical protein
VGSLAELMPHHHVPEGRGVWSLTLALNALRLPGASVLEQYASGPFPYETEASIAELRGAGKSHASATLAELTALAKACGARAELVRLDRVSPDSAAAFRRAAVAALEDPASQLIVNFSLGSNGCHSPVAAYHPPTDRMLVLTIAPPRPQAVWIQTAELLEAMATIDSIYGQPRGYLVLSAPERRPRWSGSAASCVALESPEGQARLVRCDPRALLEMGGWLDFFQVQEDPFSCGLACAAMVANRMELTAVRELRARSIGPAGIPAQLRQSDVLELIEQRGPRTSGGRLLLRDELHSARGCSIEELAAVIRMLGGRAESRAASATSLAAFKAEAVAAILSSERHVLVCYHRPVLGQVGGGHFSPLAAYEPGSDSFLLYDVAGYKVSPTWAPAELLWRAMATRDEEIGAERGWVITSR